MKLLFDLFPILLFFVAYKLHDIYVATAVAIVASFVQVGWFWWRHRRLETMHLVTLGLIAVLGGATLWLHNEDFIKWKPTVVNWLFGAAFLGSQFIGRKPLVERMMGAAISVPAAIWLRLNLSWASFFLLLGAANLYVVYHFDTDTWVNFKLFGMMGLTLAFMVVQAFYLARHIQTEPDGPENN
jgi:intracellular septation protein